MKKNVNKFYLSKSVGPDSRSITKFGCHAAVSLQDNVQECLWTQEATGLTQNIVDTAVNEYRKHLHAYVGTMGRHFKQFYCSQLKNKQLDKMSAKKIRNVNKMCFYVLWRLSNHTALDKKSNILLVLFSLGSAETDIKWGGKMNGHLMASCLRNIRAKDY